MAAVEFELRDPTKKLRLEDDGPVLAVRDADPVSVLHLQKGGDEFRAVIEGLEVPFQRFIDGKDIQAAAGVVEVRIVGLVP